MADLKRDYLFKVIVVGDMGVGKTSLIKRYVYDIFSANYKTTIGVDFALKKINIDDNTEVNLQLWDISGQERFGNMTRVYYKEAVAAIIVFDVTRYATFKCVAKWKKDVDNKLQTLEGTFPCLLLGSKCDMSDAKAVPRDEINKYLAENKFLDYFEVSSKTNHNIDKAMQKLLKYLLEHAKHEEPQPDPEIIVIKDEAQAKNTCC